MDEPTTEAPETTTPPPEQAAVAPQAPAPAAAPDPAQSFATRAAEQAELARQAAETAKQARDLGVQQNKVLEATTTSHAAELAKLVALREEIEAERNQVKADRAWAARLDRLKAAGLRDDLPPEVLADLRRTVPEVDATTPEGQAKLDAWRTSRLLYFREVESATEIAKRQEQAASFYAELEKQSPMVARAYARARAQAVKA